jgi:capsular polysaccharide biosynthesis protein
VQLAAVDTQPWIRKQQLDRVQIADFLERSIGVRVDRQTDIITLSATAPSPSEAQSLNQAILETVLAKMPPVDGTKMTMQDIVIQAPTLNDKAVKPKRLQLTAIASILSGLVLAVFVFIRAALRAVADNPDGAEKVVRIRKGILRC